MKKVFLTFLFLFTASGVYGSFLPKSFDAKFLDVRGQKEIPVVIKYQFPSNIYYEVKGDAPLLYVCNAKKTWKYTPPFIEGEKGELAIGDSGQFCYSKIFDSLSKGLESNELYSVEKKGQSATFAFKEKAKKQLSLEKIEIAFNEKISEKTGLGEAKELRLFLVNKPEPVNLRLVEFEKAPKLEKDQFSFSAPKNTNVIQMK